MQTFLPYPDFRESAHALDYRRLGKQRVEAKQILNCLKYRRTGDLYTIDKNGKTRKRGWLYHTAVEMWVGYEDALGLYMNVMIREWIDRGYNNTMDFYDFGNRLGQLVDLPPWMGDEAVHSSHRANLLRKDPEFYSQYGWVEDPTAPYIWPTNLHPA